MASLAPRIDALQSQAQNLIINGNFDFWQRGTSVNISTSFQYQADRFNAFKDATWTGTSTMARSSLNDVPTFAQSGFNSQYSLKITNGTGAAPGSGDAYLLRHVLEGNDYQLLHSAPFRLQFWVKSSLTGTFALSFLNSASNRTFVTTYTVNAANTWEKKTIDLTGDTSGTWLFDNSVGLQITWALAVGSTLQTSTLNAWQAGSFRGATGQTNWAGTTGATFQLAQVSLIQGDFVSGGTTNVDMPFRRAARTIGEELRMCQRYYEKTYKVGTAPGSSENASSINPIDVTQTAGATQGNLWIPFKVSKRVAPTMSYFNRAGSSSTTVETQQALSIAGGTTTSGTCTINTVQVSENTFSVQGSANSFSFNSTAGTCANLIFHWMADAEL